MNAVRRRSLLVAIAGTGVTGMGGCLGDTATGTNPDNGTGDNDDDGPADSEADDGAPEQSSEGDDDGENGGRATTYEECSLIAIQYEWFPDDIRAEVDAALEDGQYESAELLVNQAIDPERSYIVVDDTPYKPSVEHTGGTTLFELHEADVMKTPEPRTVLVKNEDTIEHEVHVELVNGETVIDRVVRLAPDERVTLEGPRAFGTYELSARVLTGHEGEGTFEFAVNDAAFGGLITVSEDDVLVTQVVADLSPCQWNVHYNDR